MNALGIFLHFYPDHSPLLKQQYWPDSFSVEWKIVVHFTQFSFLLDVIKNRSHRALTPVHRDFLSYTLKLWVCFFSVFPLFLSSHIGTKNIKHRRWVNISLSFSLYLFFIRYREKIAHVVFFLGSEPNTIRMNQADPYNGETHNTRSVAPSSYEIVVTHHAQKIWTYHRPYKVLLLACGANCIAGTK